MERNEIRQGGSAPAGADDATLIEFGACLKGIYARECQVLDTPPGPDDPEGRKQIGEADLIHAVAVRLSEAILARQAMTLGGLLAKVMVAKRDISPPDFAAEEGDGLAERAMKSICRDLLEMGERQSLAVAANQFDALFDRLSGAIECAVRTPSGDPSYSGACQATAALYDRLCGSRAPTARGCRMKLEHLREMLADEFEGELILRLLDSAIGDLAAFEACRTAG